MDKRNAARYEPQRASEAATQDENVQFNEDRVITVHEDLELRSAFSLKKFLMHMG